MILLDGKKVATEIRAEVRAEVQALSARCGRAPGLAVILVGGDAASQVYVRNKEKACQEAGILSLGHHLSADVSQDRLEGLILELNADPAVDGILLQLPLPKSLDAQRCLSRIDPAKDVDGFHPESAGRLLQGLPGFRPCTPAGIMRLLDRYKLSVAGKRAVVVGRSTIVGKPLALMLLAANATVTVCHSRTEDLAEECRRADFLFAAVGRPRLVTREFVKPGAVVVDVGINRTEQGLVGDCDFAGLIDIVAAITPVPGGVGPMTIAELLMNTLSACKAHAGGGPA